MKWTEISENSRAAKEAIKKLRDHDEQEQENYENAPSFTWWDPEEGLESICDYRIQEHPLSAVVENTVESTAYNMFLYYADLLDGVDNDKELMESLEDCFDGYDEMFIIDALVEYAKQNHLLVGNVFKMLVEDKIQVFDGGREFFIAN